jgi:hypothetical protein
VAGSTAAVAVQWLAPVLIGLSVLLLGRAFYILYVHRRGTRVSKVLTWMSALFVVGFWTWRLI